MIHSLRECRRAACRNVNLDRRAVVLVFLILTILCAAAGLAAPVDVPRLAPPPLPDPSTTEQVEEGSAERIVFLTQGLSVNTQNRADVVTFWNTEYQASQGIAAGWTGSIATCNAGDTSETYKQATLRRLNFFRAMTGLPGAVVLDATLNDKCQDAALMMIANTSLSHSPPSTWACWTQDGADAAAKSNIALGAHGPAAINLYIEDPGSFNYSVGHRRWILYPPLATVGTGSTDAINGSYRGSNCLWVIGVFGTRPAIPEWVAWPPPGYVPYPVVYARWSFSYKDANFDNATVTMTQGGQPVGVTLETVDNRGFGDRTVVWVPQVQAGARPAQDTTYSVTVANVVIGGTPRQFQYDVTVIDPASSPATPTQTPAPSLTQTPSPTSTPVPTSTPAPTQTPLPSPTQTPIPSPSATPPPSPSPSPTPADTSLPTPTAKPPVGAGFVVR